MNGYLKEKRSDSTTIEYIQSILHQNEQSRTCVCGVGILRNKLFVEELKNAIEQPLFETDFYKNTEALKVATVRGTIYLMLELNETTKRELENALNACRQQNIGVKGVIATEQA